MHSTRSAQPTASHTTPTLSHNVSVKCDRLAIAAVPSNHGVETVVATAVNPRKKVTAMTLANATTRTAADEAFIAKALSDAQRALAKRQSPTVVKPASCLAKFKAEKGKEIVKEVAKTLPLVSLVLPKPGTMTAAEFLATVRESGPVFTGDCSVMSDPTIWGERNRFDFGSRRDQAILAIAAYCGYDRYAEFGIQEYNARLRAQREVQGQATPKTYKRGTMAIVGGYVHGMPFETQKVLMDLEARIRVAAEDMAAAEHAADKALAAGGADAIAQAAAHRDMARQMQDLIIELRGKLNTILNAC